MPTFQAPDGREIAFADTGGTGEAILCLAGITRTKADYEVLADRLRPTHRVIRMDYRGRGESQWATDPIAEDTVLTEGQDAVALLAHLGLPRVTIVGTSRGGLIGMLLAATQPALVRALIINDIGPVLEQRGLDLIMTHLGRDPGFADFEAAANGLRDLLSDDFPTLSDGDWLAFARRTYADDDGRSVLNYDPKLRDATEAAFAQPTPDLWPMWEAIACPVLTIRGENSDLLSDVTLAEMAKRSPAMAAVTVPNRGHVPFLDEPEAVAAIDAFLAEHAT